MNARELRRIHRTRPFRAFRLHLADGREIPVTHPENLMVTSDGRTAVVFVQREGLEILDLPLTTGLELRKSPSARGQ